MFLDDNKVTEVVSATATGTTTISGAVVDMQGYDEVTFICSLGTAAADNGIKVQQGTDATVTDAADLLGSSVLCNGTGKVLVQSIVRPRERYVRPQVVRGTTTTINSVIAIRSRCRRGPQTNTVTNALASETNVSPAEGTA